MDIEESEGERVCVWWGPGIKVRACFLRNWNLFQGFRHACNETELDRGGFSLPSQSTTNT